VVKREIEEGMVTDEAGTNWGVKGFCLVVMRPSGGKVRYYEEEIHRAYEMALNGPRPKQQPSGDPAKFGDDPPF
jgi:hypothetical protein